MNTDTHRAQRRPTLSLNFGAKGIPSAPAGDYRSPTLSTHELRRLVAAMVD